MIFHVIFKIVRGITGILKPSGNINETKNISKNTYVALLSTSLEKSAYLSNHLRNFYFNLQKSQ